MEYTVAICDDEPVQRTYLAALLEKWAHAKRVVLHVSSFHSAESLLFAYAENKTYDILLLDIEMGGWNGIELAKTIRAENKAVQILFVTGYADYLADGYDVAALHYLMKPVDTQKLFSVLDRACINLDKTECAIVLPIDGESVRVATDQIMWIEAYAHSVVIHTVEQVLEVKRSLSDVATMLGDQLVLHSFLRCHRSYLVALRCIRQIARDSIVLDDGTTLPLARSAYHAVNQAFIDFYRSVR